MTPEQPSRRQRRRLAFAEGYAAGRAEARAEAYKECARILREHHAKNNREEFVLARALVAIERAAEAAKDRA